MPTVTSEVEIVNLGLVHLGIDKLNSLSDDRPAARYGSLLYPISRDATLRDHPWNFNLRRVSLTKLTTTPSFGYDAEFQLPNDYLAIRGVDEATPGSIDYKIEGSKLLCNETSMKILYSFRETNVSTYDPMCVQAMGLKMASDLAYNMLNSVNAAERFFAKYEHFLGRAKVADAREGFPVKPIEGNWLTIRI